MKRITKIEGNTVFLNAVRKTRVAAYCRVSTGSDEQLLSLETQKDHYERYIKAHPDWKYAGLYYDLGITGTKKDKRPALMQMVADCEDGRIDRVITKSISRFCRNTTDCLELVRKLLGLGIPIYFEKEDLDTGSMESELMLSILSSLAESESVSIAENSKWSIRRRFENGTFKLAYPPYGYDYIGDGEWAINEEQAKWVRYIYSETLSGKGSDAIAAELIELGAPTKKGGKWTSTTVRGILSNEKYTGDCIFQKTYTDERFNRHTNYGEMDQFYMEGHHDAIVSREDFEAVAALVEQRAKEKGITKGDAKYQARYPMSGKVFCGECGSPHKRRMNYSTHIQYPALTCSGHLKDKNSCSQKFIREDALQMAFVTMMNKLIFAHKEVLQPLLTSLRSISQKDAISRLSELDERLEKNAERQNTLTTLMTRGYIDPALFTQESNDLLTEAQALTEEKEHLVFSVNGEMKKTEKLADLIRFCSRGEMLTEFEGDCFSQYVERVVIHERTTAAFELKCGLTLKERIR